MRVRVAKEAGLGESSILGTFFTKRGNPLTSTAMGTSGRPLSGPTPFGSPNCCSLQWHTQNATISALVKSLQHHHKLFLDNHLCQAQAMWIACCHIVRVTLNKVVESFRRAEGPESRRRFTNVSGDS
jgi:hypothetical protein